MKKSRGKIKLKEAYPNIALEWHQYKNKPLTPEDVPYGSGKKVWWKCSKCNNEWYATICNRTNIHLNRGCPECSNKKTSKRNVDRQLSSIHNLSLYKDVLKEWHPSKNKGLIPSEFTPKSNKKVWWKCLICGYEWISQINFMVEKKKVCLHCRSLKNLFPNIAKEWSEKNDKTSLDFFAKSGKKVWWKCSICKKEWEATIASRTLNGNGCPHCKSITLNDNTTWDSLTEAYLYLIFKRLNLNFSARKQYPHSTLKYDFYFPHSNTYIEVTGYHKGSKKYYAYLRKIAKKKKHVTQILKANFIFIQIKLNNRKRKIVRKHKLKIDNIVNI